MTSYLGSDRPKMGNYVPQPEPRYTPDGYHRCEKCNRLVKDGNECACGKKRAKEQKPAEVRTDKFDWRKYGEQTLKERANGRDGNGDEPREDVLGAGAPAAGHVRHGGHLGGSGQMENCPFCGNHSLQLMTYKSRYKVRCINCVTVYGPAGKTKEEAVELWNRRPE